MDPVTIRKAKEVRGEFHAPPSKSYTHRAFLAAALADGVSRVSGPLESADTIVTRSALSSMGVRFVADGNGFTIRGTCGTLVCPEPPVIDMAESGTSLRLIMSVALLCPCPVTLTGGPRIRERPVGDLAASLQSLGAAIRYTGRPGCPPVTVSGPVRGGEVCIAGTTSSQFISSVLMTAPCWDAGVVVRVTGEPVSASYLDITLDVMKRFGIPVSRQGYQEFCVVPGLGYKAAPYHVEGDYSSASYLFAAAAVAGGKVTGFNLAPDSVQGDRAFLDRLKDMGCSVHAGFDIISVESDGCLEGIEADMSSAPDTVPTLCAVAACASTPTCIRGVAHLRFKESDRVHKMGEVLRACGAGYEATGDTITITPGPLKGTTVDPANDHRIAMSAAVLGLKTGGMKILNPGCVSKSYPGFFSDFSKVVR